MRMRTFLPGIMTLIVLTLVSCSASSSPVVIERTGTILAGRTWEWDLSDYAECRYHFTVRQTGAFGDVDIGFQGQRYIEKDGVFYGDTFTLNNGYSLSTAKVVDLILRCQRE